MDHRDTGLTRRTATNNSARTSAGKAGTLTVATSQTCSTSRRYFLDSSRIHQRLEALEQAKAGVRFRRAGSEQLQPADAESAAEGGHFGVVAGGEVHKDLPGSAAFSAG